MKIPNRTRLILLACGYKNINTYIEYSDRPTKISGNNAIDIPINSIELSDAVISSYKAIYVQGVTGFNLNDRLLGIIDRVVESDASASFSMGALAVARWGRKKGVRERERTITLRAFSHARLRA